MLLVNIFDYYSGKILKVSVAVKNAASMISFRIQRLFLLERPLGSKPSLPGVRQRPRIGGQAGAWKEAQALVVTPMLCRGMASYGACAMHPLSKLGNLG